MALGILAAVFGPASANDAYLARLARTDAETETETPTSATEMARQYAINEVAADDQFKGRLLLVRGTVKTIATDTRSTPYVILAGGDAADTQAMFTTDETGRLGTLRRGDEITVRCRGGGKLFNIFLKDCTVR